MLAVLLQEQGHTVQHVVTFGQPKATPQTLQRCHMTGRASEVLNTADVPQCLVPVLRVVNVQDIVTKASQEG